MSKNQWISTQLTEAKSPPSICKETKLKASAPPTQLVFQLDPRLATLGLHQHQPCIQLRPWVQLYWSLKVTEVQDPAQSHALYPDGGSNLLFEFQPNQLPTCHFRYKQQLSQARFRTGMQLLSIRFHPTGAFQLLGLSPTEVSDLPLDLRLLNPPGLNWLLDQLAQHCELANQVMAVECWLLHLAEQSGMHPSLVQKSLPLLQQPAADLQHVYQQLPKSRRQFERQFKLETGLSPAQLQLLLKVKLARFIISNDPSCNLAAVAQQAGFYDQAHLHQHFSRITGQTPGQYKKRKMSHISNSAR